MIELLVWLQSVAPGHQVLVVLDVLFFLCFYFSTVFVAGVMMGKKAENDSVMADGRRRFEQEIEVSTEMPTLRCFDLQTCQRKSSSFKL